MVLYELSIKGTYDKKKIFRIRQNVTDKKSTGLTALLTELAQFVQCKSYDELEIYFIALILLRLYPALKFKVEEKKYGETSNCNNKGNTRDEQAI